MEKIYDVFAHVAVKKRKKLKLSQNQVAVEAGMTRGTLWSFERGGRKAMFCTVAAIADVLNIPLEPFLELESAERNSEHPQRRSTKARLAKLRRIAYQRAGV